MFDDAVTRLLRGDFVCEVSAPDAFRYLSKEENFREVDGYLGRIGRSLALTTGGRAYYAAYRQVGPGERTDVRRLFGEIKHDLRPVIHFLNFAMRAQKLDQVLSPGDRLEYTGLLKAVDESEDLKEMLQGFAATSREYASNDARLSAQLEKVLQTLVKNGYLLLANRERGLYVVTGKIEYFYQIAEFLMENESIRDETEGEPEPVTGRLL